MACGPRLTSTQSDRVTCAPHPTAGVVRLDMDSILVQPSGLLNMRMLLLIISIIIYVVLLFWNRNLIFILCISSQL